MNPEGLTNRALFFFYTFFIFSSTFSIAAGQVSIGFSCITFLLLVIITKYQPIRPELKWFYTFCGLYIFWMALAGEVVSPGLDALDKMREEWLFLAVLIGIYLFQNTKRARFMVNAFAVGTAFVSLYSVGQYVWGWTFLKQGYELIVDQYGYRIVGNFTHPLTFANYYATAGLFFYGYALAKNETLSSCAQWFYRIVSMLAIGVAVLSFSRGPTIAITVTLGLSVLLLRSKKAVVWASIMLGVLLLVGLKSGVFARADVMMQSETSQQNGIGRMFIWKHSAQIVKAHPFLGVGPGNFPDAYKLTLDPSDPKPIIHGHAHDDLLNVAAQSGVLGALFFLAMWVTVWVYSWKAYQSPQLTDSDKQIALAGLLGAVCFFATSLTEATFADEEVRQMLMFVWAAGLAMYLKSRLQYSATN